VQSKLRSIGRSETVPAELLELKARFSTEFPNSDAALERAMLVLAGQVFLESVLDFPADESVKHLICKELLSYAHPPANLERFAFGHYNFSAMCKIVSGERFPGGLLHWEISGFARSWFLRMPVTSILPTFLFTLKDTRGFHPFFVSHMGGLAARIPIVTESALLKSFCRVCLAAEKNPAIKGFVAVSWLHSKETHRVSPHLAFMNRPYLESGGCYFEVGLKPESGALLKGDPGRAKLYGRYVRIVGGVMCSRQQLISWLHNHPEVASNLAVR
jgi:hypothetical protein